MKLGLKFITWQFGVHCVLVQDLFEHNGGEFPWSFICSASVWTFFKWLKTTIVENSCNFWKWELKDIFGNDKRGRVGLTKHKYIFHLIHQIKNQSDSVSSTTFSERSSRQSSLWTCSLSRVHTWRKRGKEPINQRLQSSPNNSPSCCFWTRRRQPDGQRNQVCQGL